MTPGDAPALQRSNRRRSGSPTKIMPDRVGKMFGNPVNISEPGQQPLPRFKKALRPEEGHAASRRESEPRRSCREATAALRVRSLHHKPGDIPLQPAQASHGRQG